MLGPRRSLALGSDTGPLTFSPSFSACSVDGSRSTSKHSPPSLRVPDHGNDARMAQISPLTFPIAPSVSMISLPPKEPRKRVERDVQGEILVVSSRIRGVRLIRNNVGCLPDERGIPIKYGLGAGSPDLVGAITFGGVNTCEPSTLGSTALAVLRTMRPIAITVAIEVKKPDARHAKGLPHRWAKRDRAQPAWHAMARKRGVETAVCKSAEDAATFLIHTIEVTWSRMRALLVCA